MRKLFVLLMAFAAVSCTGYTEYDELVEEKVEYVSPDDYATMYDFVMMVRDSELFDLELPSTMTYDEMMRISAHIVMTDLFGDTIGEGDCEDVYRLMLAYYLVHDPDATITSYLSYILENGMY